MVKTHQEQYQKMEKSLSTSGEMKQSDKEVILTAIKAHNEQEEAKLGRKAQEILENPTNWEKQRLDSSKLKLKTSGYQKEPDHSKKKLKTSGDTNEPSISEIKYSTVRNNFQKWRTTIQKRKDEKKEEVTDEKVKEAEFKQPGPNPR